MGTFQIQKWRLFWGVGWQAVGSTALLSSVGVHMHKPVHGHRSSCSGSGTCRSLIVQEFGSCQECFPISACSPMTKWQINTTYTGVWLIKMRASLWVRTMQRALSVVSYGTHSQLGVLFQPHTARLLFWKTVIGLKDLYVFVTVAGFIACIQCTHSHTCLTAVTIRP